MKSESQIMSELSHKTHYLRELSSEESKALKDAILNIYKDVAALCDKHRLTYMMSGGTCLGAVRHHGFIPWDDDLDIMMPRKDYDALICLLEAGKLGPQYEFTCPNAHKDANTIFLKIFRRNSKDIEIHNVNTPFPKGIYLDVFALDAVPEAKITQKLKGFFANAIQYIAISTLYTQYPSKQLKEYMMMDSSLKSDIILRKSLELFVVLPLMQNGFIGMTDLLHVRKKGINGVFLPDVNTILVKYLIRMYIYQCPKESLKGLRLIFLTIQIDI